MPNHILNLIFSKQNNYETATGLFNDYNPNFSGQRSKAWYTLPAGWPTGWPSNAQQGIQVQQAPSAGLWATTATPDQGPLLDLPYSIGDLIFIRFAPDSSWGQGANLSMTDYMVVFGRPDTSNHGWATLASTFTHSVYTAATFTPRTMFGRLDTTGPNVHLGPPGPDGSWIFFIGPIAQNVSGQIGDPPKHPHDNTRSRVYSFNVGASVVLNPGSTTQEVYSFGHDPGMGVKG